MQNMGPLKLFGGKRKEITKNIHNCFVWFHCFINSYKELNNFGKEVIIFWISENSPIIYLLYQQAKTVPQGLILN